MNRTISCAEIRKTNLPFTNGIVYITIGLWMKTTFTTSTCVFICLFTENVRIFFLIAIGPNRFRVHRSVFFFILSHSKYVRDICCEVHSMRTIQHSRFPSKITLDRIEQKRKRRKRCKIKQAEKEWNEKIWQ